MTRTDDISVFLIGTEMAGAEIAPLAQDASSRRYFRVQKGAKAAVLMDAPQPANPPQTAFVDIARWLAQAGFSAPEMIAADIESGLLLCEDLGDAVFSDEFDAGRLREDTAFSAVADMLQELHQHTPMPGLPVYTPQSMADMIAPLFDHYMPQDRRKPEAEEQIKQALATILAQTWLGDPVIILRDFHAGNLIWLPEREGHKSVGLLDFQDAAVGHAAYDLVSMLFDIRREINPDLAERIIRDFATACDLPQDSFRAACAAQSVQRNLRILGIFARLATDLGKTGYLKWQPAVWARLMADLEHPVMAPLKDLIRGYVPAPSKDGLPA